MFHGVLLRLFFGHLRHAEVSRSGSEPAPQLGPCGVLNLLRHKGTLHVVLCAVPDARRDTDSDSVAYTMRRAVIVGRTEGHRLPERVKPLPTMLSKV